jgi:hypothetical protein
MLVEQEVVDRAHQEPENVQEAAASVASVDAQGVGAPKACHVVSSLAFFPILIFPQYFNEANLDSVLRPRRRLPKELKQNDV